MGNLSLPGNPRGWETVHLAHLGRRSVAEDGKLEAQGDAILAEPIYVALQMRAMKETLTSW